MTFGIGTREQGGCVSLCKFIADQQTTNLPFLEIDSITKYYLTVASDSGVTLSHRGNASSSLQDRVGGRRTQLELEQTTSLASLVVRKHRR